MDAGGRLHVERIQAVPDSPSLVDLRRRLEAMMPRVDLPELVLEVMPWRPRSPRCPVRASPDRPARDDRRGVVRARPQRRLRADHLPWGAGADPAVVVTAPMFSALHKVKS